MESDEEKRAKQAHGRALREALAETPDVDRADIQALTTRSYRTVTNWLNGHNMPNEADKATLRRLLGNYEQAGDAVEKAVRRSELEEYRQYEVIGFYKKHLQEQRSREAG